MSRVSLSRYLADLWYVYTAYRMCRKYRHAGSPKRLIGRKTRRVLEIDGAQLSVALDMREGTELDHARDFHNALLYLKQRPIQIAMRTRMPPTTPIIVPQLAASYGADKLTEMHCIHHHAAMLQQGDRMLIPY